MGILSQRKQALKWADEARREVAAASEKARRVREDSRLTDEGKEAAISDLVKEVRSKLDSSLVKLQDGASKEITEARSRLDKARGASAEDIAEARARLTPVLQAAGENPDALIRAYEKRHANPADRRILEEAASVLIDSGLGGVTFPEKFHAIRRRVEESAPEPEQKAGSEVGEAEDLRGYLDNAATITGMNLAQTTRSLSTGEMIYRDNARAAVHRYESAHGESSHGGESVSGNAGYGAA